MISGGWRCAKSRNPCFFSPQNALRKFKSARIRAAAQDPTFFHACPFSGGWKCAIAGVPWRGFSFSTLGLGGFVSKACSNKC